VIITGAWGRAHGPYGSTKSCTSDDDKLDRRETEFILFSKFFSPAKIKTIDHVLYSLSLLYNHQSKAQILTMLAARKFC